MGNSAKAGTCVAMQASVLGLDPNKKDEYQGVRMDKNASK
jgi:hypothetical protein